MTRAAVRLSIGFSSGASCACPGRTSTAIAVTEPVVSPQERLALAGFLAGYTGLTREAYTLDLRQFTAWCQVHHLRLFQARRADISVPDDVALVVDGALSAFGGVDVLVCNAGVYGPMGPVDRIGWDDWVHALHVNLCGSVFCCRAVLPHFRAQKRGKIILLSGGGEIGAS